jgi:hypothetical protein
MVFFERIIFGVTELATKTIFFYGRPAGLAGIEIDLRRAANTVQNIRYNADKIAKLAQSLFQSKFQNSNFQIKPRRQACGLNKLRRRARLCFTTPR